MDGRDTGHLAASLDGHDENGSSGVGPTAEKVDIGDFLVGVFVGDLSLDELVLCEDVGIVSVTVGVQLG